MSKRFLRHRVSQSKHHPPVMFSVVPAFLGMMDGQFLLAMALLGLVIGIVVILTLSKPERPLPPAEQPTRNDVSTIESLPDASAQLQIEADATPSQNDYANIPVVLGIEELLQEQPQQTFNEHLNTALKTKSKGLVFRFGAKSQLKNARLINQIGKESLTAQRIVAECFQIDRQMDLAIQEDQLQVQRNKIELLRLQKEESQALRALKREEKKALTQSNAPEDEFFEEIQASLSKSVLAPWYAEIVASQSVETGLKLLNKRIAEIEKAPLDDAIKESLIHELQFAKDAWILPQVKDATEQEKAKYQR